MNLLCRCGHVRTGHTTYGAICLTHGCPCEGFVASDTPMVRCPAWPDHCKARKCLLCGGTGWMEEWQSTT